jgi:molybdopterin-guanine dinucleotide biosynthesis protein B
VSRPGSRLQARWKALGTSGAGGCRLIAIWLHELGPRFEGVLLQSMRLAPDQGQVGARFAEPDRGIIGPVQRKAGRERRRRAPVIAFSGPSGSGKTRLLTRLVPVLVRRGLRVGALKHSGHRHGFDRRGKDSERIAAAGALAVVVEGPASLAYFGPPVGGAVEMARLLPPVDVVVAEGFKSDRIWRVEVHRRAIDHRFLCARDRRVVAVVTDEPAPRPIPAFSPREVEQLADFLCRRFRLGRGSPERRRRQRRRAAAPSMRTDVHPLS